MNKNLPLHLMYISFKYFFFQEKEKILIIFLIDFFINYKYV